MAKKKKSILSWIERSSYPGGTREYDKMMSGNMEKWMLSPLPTKEWGELHPKNRKHHPRGTRWFDAARKGQGTTLRDKAERYRSKNYNNPWNSMKFYKSLITGKE